MLAGLQRLGRVVRAAPRHARAWLAGNGARIVAAGWLGGMGVFGYTTVQRARDVRAAEAAVEDAAPRVAKPVDGDGPGEVVAMLDVDQMNQLRTDRMHAAGIGDGDGAAPDLAAIAEARERLGDGIAVDGDIVGKTGNIVIVTKGGIKGWIARNKDKKADPETLAWLRAEEAADGRAAYAGWADREDGDVLAWAKQERATAPAAGDAVALAEVMPAPASASAAGDAPANDAADPVAPTPASSTPPAIEPAARISAAPATASAPTVRLDLPRLRALGAAARSALAITDHEPTPAEHDQLRARLGPIAATGVTIVARDRHIVLSLVGDHLFAPGAPHLTRKGAQLTRELARALRGVPDRAFRLTVDADRAMEIASMLVIGGLDADRLEVVLVDHVDRAIDLIEIALVPAAYGDEVAP